MSAPSWFYGRGAEPMPRRACVLRLVDGESPEPFALGRRHRLLDCPCREMGTQQRDNAQSSPMLDYRSPAAGRQVTSSGQRSAQLEIVLTGRVPQDLAPHRTQPATV